MKNVDIFPAGISERTTVDGQLGPTFTCLVGEQMRKLKLGDRLYYSHPGAKFTPGTVYEYIM